MGPKVSEGAKAYSIVEVNLGLLLPLWGKKKQNTSDSTQMFLSYMQRYHFLARIGMIDQPPLKHFIPSFPI